MDIALVRWPEERARREQLATRGQPRLLLVDPGVTPPLPTDHLEDWIRVPVVDEDARARVRGLEARLAASGHDHPIMVGTAMLRFRGQQIELTPLQSRLLRPLLSSFGAVVGRSELETAGWPEGLDRRNTLEVSILRLRQQLAAIGLEIRSVRSRGYVLTTSADPESNVSFL